MSNGKAIDFNPLRQAFDALLHEIDTAHARAKEAGDIRATRQLDIKRAELWTICDNAHFDHMEPSLNQPGLAKYFNQHGSPTE